jgi:hypothetical protein
MILPVRGGKPVAFAESAHEMLDQQGQIFFAVAQGGDPGGQNIDPVEEVLPHESLPDALLQIPVGGCDKTDVDLADFMAPDGNIAVPVQNAQQLDLHVEAQFAQLVQKKGAAVGQVEIAFLVLVGARKSAPLVAEKFAFHQVFRNGAAIDGNKVFILSIGEVMNGPGHKLLARGNGGRP